MEEGLLSSSSGCVKTRRCTATPMVFFSVSVVACGALAYGFALGYTSPAESGMMEDLGFSIAEYSVFCSILKFGGMLGAILSGKMADFVGRRGTMWILDLCFICGWIPVIFGKNALWFDSGRFLMGFGCGLYCYVAPIYIGEIAPKEIRGGFIAYASFAVVFGFSLMFSLGNFINWHTLALVGVLPCFTQVLGIFFIPESPRWLANIGSEKGLETALWSLRGKDADISSEAAEIIENAETIHQEPKSTFWDLFDRRYAHHLLVGVGLMVLVQFTGSDGISSYTSSIFEAAGCPAGMASTLLAVVQLPMAFLSVPLMDRVGRRPILMATAAVSCLACFLVGLGFLFKAHDIWKEITPFLVLIGILMNSSSISAGLNCTPWVVMSEIFPMNIKGTGGSLVALSSWFGSWIITYAFNFLFEWSSSGAFFIFSTVCASIVLFVVKLVPETKGRTLEEIQASMVLFK